jgi:hypothetical protein
LGDAQAGPVDPRDVAGESLRLVGYVSRDLLRNPHIVSAALLSACPMGILILGGLAISIVARAGVPLGPVLPDTARASASMAAAAPAPEAAMQ